MGLLPCRRLRGEDLGRKSQAKQARRPDDAHGDRAVSGLHALSNDDRDVRTGRKLTDEQLCADWQWEFPDAVTFIPFHVKGVRRDFVAGKCAKAKADRRTVSAALTAGWWAARTARNTEGPARHRQASMARNDKRHPSET